MMKVEYLDFFFFFKVFSFDYQRIKKKTKHNQKQTKTQDISTPRFNTS